MSAENLPENESEEQELIEHFRIEVDGGQTLLRLDKYLSDKLPKFSRNKIQDGVKNGNIQVNDQAVKSNYKVKPNDVVTVTFAEEKEDFKVIPEPVPLNIVYEDDDLLVINKPAGLVVHPGNGNKSGTLVNGLLHHIQNLPVGSNGLDRPGIVHRIDKLTSGLMLAAKTEHALNNLAMQFFNRTIDRKYTAFVWGEPEEEVGRIEGNIGRSLKNRKLMNVFPEGDFGKTAITNYEIKEKLGYITVIQCKLETGRTHQIRVHLKHVGHPLFGDPEYGGDRILKGTTFNKYKQFVQNCLNILPRQALHAQSIGFEHPTTKEWMQFSSDLPEDMQLVLDKWRGYVSTRQDLV
jgi:23S rRNA pseudouridine1911/1915/1917 synthase